MRKKFMTNVTSALIGVNMEFVGSVRKLASARRVAGEKIEQEGLERWGIKDVILRPYQLEGVSWLAERFDRGHGCILGDEMGLGKTLQSISLLLYLHHNKSRRGPNLVVSPLSVINNWETEILRCGLQLPTGEEDEKELIKAQDSGLAQEEREKLLSEIASLKEEIASMRSSSLLGDQQPRDIVQASTRMVSEYKTKLQMAEADKSRLEGTVNRLQGQVTRYKNQVKELEEREDELMKEKRQQSKEIRTLQSEAEDARTEIDLLKRRIEQLKKRRDYSTDS